MADNRTMAELLRAPTEGYAEAIVVPSNLAEQFELKHSLINMMTTDQFFRLEKDNLHDHIRCKPIAFQVKACDTDSSSEIAKLTHAVNQQTSVVTTAMTAMLKQFQATPPPALVKDVEEICVTCGGSGSLLSNIVANPKGELKAITTRSGLVTDGPTIPTPPKFVTPEVDERVEKTYTDLDLAEYTIKVPPPPVQKYNPPSQREFVVHKRDPLHPNMPYPSRMLKQKQQEKDKSPFIVGRPFLRTARALTDVHGEEMILRDGDKRLTLNMKHDTSSYSNQPQRESVNLINIFNVSSEDFLEFDIESGLKEIEFLLCQDKDSSVKDSIDQKGVANLDAIFVDPIPEMFTDEHTLDYSSPLKFDAYDDDSLEVECDAKNVYNDPFDSKGEKIKESKLLIDELDLPCDFLPPFEYDSFISQDFSRVDALPSTNNEDKYLTQ
nr:reverse transcriptase domain-containing protein [Tanacetum cinerariifolium]